MPFHNCTRFKEREELRLSLKSLVITIESNRNYRKIFELTVGFFFFFTVRDWDARTDGPIWNSSGRILS